jgi:hypothetical protein
MANKDIGLTGFPTDPVEAKLALAKDSVRQTGTATNYEDAIRNISRQSGYGDLTTAITNTYFGINHRGAGNPVPLNNESTVLTFFTRPRLNLSYDNIKMLRKLTPLLNDDLNSRERAIRAYLDPDGSREHYKSNLVDPYNPFISLLTNNLTSISGWPDPDTPIYTSEAGIYGEQWAMTDGTGEITSVITVSANFRNIINDPITYLFHLWSRYQTYVYEGKLTPRPDSILENEIDYMTRIWRINLDSTKQYVTRIAVAPAAFPKTDSTGAAFNHSEDNIFTRDTDEVSCEFVCLGVEYYDPIHVLEFNDLVVMFNPDMLDGRREKKMTPLSPALKPIFNYMGYPRINPYTSEFEWWVPTALFKEVIGQIKLPDYLKE